MANTTISKARKYKNNPRQITKKQMELLKDHLDRYGDLSGVVLDLNSGEYAGGNMRTEHFDGCEVVYTERYDEPTEQGTVALGYIISKTGEKFNYREVRWDEDTFKKACIVANHDGGTWDFDILNSLFDGEELFELGFEDWELGLEKGELLSAAGGENNADGAGANYGEVGSEHIRMMQLFLSESQFERVTAIVEARKAEFNTETTTDTIFAIIESYDRTNPS
jgi:hypothetical protein